MCNVCKILWEKIFYKSDNGVNWKVFPSTGFFLNCENFNGWHEIIDFEIGWMNGCDAGLKNYSVITSFDHNYNYD